MMLVEADRKVKRLNTGDLWKGSMDGLSFSLEHFIGRLQRMFL